MASTLQVPGQECCVTPCDEILVQNIPGPAGPAGAACVPCDDGLSSFTFTTANFTQPAVSGTVLVSVQSSDMFGVGQVVFSEFAGYLQVTALNTPTSMTLLNLGYAGNAAPATVIPLAHKIGAGGIQGPAGSAPAGSFLVANNLSEGVPATMRNNLGMPANTAALYDYDVFVHDPGVVTDLAVVRWDGVTGHEVQNSPMLLTDTGDFQIGTGNAKGTNAVDLQSQRTVATQVASGAESAIGGGESNAAFGANATVPGGRGNIAQGQSSIAMGESNLASGPYSMASGLQSGAFVHGQRSHAAGMFAAIADCVFTDLLMRNSTIDATATELFLDGASLRLTIGVAALWNFHIMVVGYRNNGDCAAWRFDGALKNIANVVTLVGTVAGVLVGADAGCAASWGQLANVVIDANDVNDALRITVTGTAANTIRWGAHVQIMGVQFP